MTSLHVEVKDEQGKPLADGTIAKTERYGQLVGLLAEKALGAAKPVRLTPLTVRTQSFFMPLDNPLYQVAFTVGVLKRQAYVWNDDPLKAVLYEPKTSKQAKLSIRSEVGWIKLGDLEIAAIPGEIYPELVLNKVQDPPDPGADFRDAPIEPGIYAQMKGPHRMIIGLANDEIGYIIPKRQWDEKPPYCYGRKRAQYGEQNSIGPDAAPILCEVFKKMVAE
jgi:hypothetical protein